MKLIKIINSDGAPYDWKADKKLNRALWLINIALFILTLTIGSSVGSVMLFKLQKIQTAMIVYGVTGVLMLLFFIGILFHAAMLRNTSSLFGPNIYFVVSDSDSNS